MPRRTRSSPAQIESVLHPKIPTDYERCDVWRLWLDYGDEHYGPFAIEFKLSHPPQIVETPDWLAVPFSFYVPATPAYARRAVVWARRSRVECPADIVDLASKADDGNDDSPLARRTD